MQVAGADEGAAQDLGNRTWVVIGLTQADGTDGFIILVNQVNKEGGDSSNGTESGKELPKTGW